MTTALKNNYKASLAKGTTLTTIEGKDVLFSVKTGESFGLNEIAARMLGVLCQFDAQTAVRKIVQEYAAPQAEIMSDLNELVLNLINLKLLDLSAD